MVSSISLDECASQCVAQEGYKCTGMSYCGNTTTCLLPSVADGNTPMSTDDKTGFCAAYTSKYETQIVSFILQENIVILRQS